ncbi:MAG: hypothetical protein IKP61_11140, partial [Spirochaetales bacterium]|nr:hypothetical protein [Spirochaetales bacterium]
MTEIKVNREHKDRVFRLIFGGNDKSWTLSLYNAVNGSDYTNPDDITITTIEDALYLNMKNDVSFLIADTMNMYEHQSTYNPNMPLRMFLYAGMVYSAFAEDLNTYSDRLQRIPAPRLIVFYNGKKELNDEVVLKLSDAFPEGMKGDMEVDVHMLNINYGSNKELMKRCRPLSDYSNFISNVRLFKVKGKEMADAVHLAINELGDDSPIKDYLQMMEAEVLKSCITEYDEQKVMDKFREEYIAEGLQKGL